MVSSRDASTISTLVTSATPDAIYRGLIAILDGPQGHIALTWLKRLGGVLFVTGLLNISNRVLNTLALNGWALRSDRSQWDWPQEVAVVTGGCSGIGLLIVKGLIEKSVRVAVMDVRDPPQDIKDGTLPRL